ncbi:hypothetical protein GCM10011583_18540 [Streptomyces camponoticapitis]|uniref:Uncharacterized protein n=1 Tax=Streptomyces camponoticapitis TaxID=1616125 RepID=A0ABQ2E1F1_9ACTN|nr:hypothetical protein [Streptomyces camponoticapitis]GGJ87290.1 hypothetical protein GCM10011583_18540 [Streptomyces camponoticapitis]
MSIVQDLCTRARHRGHTPFQLIQKIGRLERENDGMACQMVGLTTENGELRAERNQLGQQLDTARIELSGAREDLAAQTAELIALRAFKANVLAVSVPAVGTRQVEPDDRPTEPAGINVRPLWDALRDHAA